MWWEQLDNNVISGELFNSVGDHWHHVQHKLQQTEASKEHWRTIICLFKDIYVMEAQLEPFSNKKKNPNLTLTLLLVVVVRNKRKLRTSNKVNMCQNVSGFLKNKNNFYQNGFEFTATILLNNLNIQQASLQLDARPFLYGWML